MKTLKYLLPALAFVVIVGFLLVGLGRNPSEIPSPLVGKPAPAWALPGLAGDDAMLRSEALAGEPYLLNVWASWCAPCLQEHPHLIALAERKVVRIVGINYKDRPEDARAWLARHGNPFTQVVADRDGRTAIDFGVYGVPETFLVDGKGVIRFKHIGALTDEAMQSRLLPAIEELRRAAPAHGAPQ